VKHVLSALVGGDFFPALTTIRAKIERDQAKFHLGAPLSLARAIAARGREREGGFHAKCFGATYIMWNSSSPPCRKSKSRVMAYLASAPRKRSVCGPNNVTHAHGLRQSAHAT